MTLGVGNTYATEINNFSDLKTELLSATDSVINITNDIIEPLRTDDPITINKNLTIYGNNNSISIPNSTGAFITQETIINIENVGSVDENNTPIKGFYNHLNNMQGGGVLCGTSIDLTIKNSVFYNNSSSDNYGGVLFLGDGSVSSTPITEKSKLSIINSTFVNNTAKQGGAIYLQGVDAQEINGYFENNKATYMRGGAIFLNSSLANSTTVEKISGTFKNNFANSSGGAISLVNTSRINNIENATFEGNTANTFGGAIGVSSATSSIGKINADFKNNSGQNGGAIYFQGVVEEIKGNFVGNSATQYGGAICSNVNSTVNVSGTFKNNTAGIIGGAIAHLKGTLNIIADNSVTEFTGNTASIGSNALYNDMNTVVNFNAGNSNIIFNDGIYNDGTININDASVFPELTKGTVEINNTFEGGVINLYDGVLKFGNNTQGSDYFEGNIADATLNIFGGKINLVNNTIQNTHLGDLVLNTDLNYSVDGKWDTQIIDTITVDSFVSNGNSIILNSISILEPTTKEQVNFQTIGDIADDTVKTALAEAITYSGGDVIMTPIYKYKYAGYNNQTGVLTFNRHDNDVNNIPNTNGAGGSTQTPENLSPSYADLNPGVMASSIATQIGALTQSQTLQNAFFHMDRYSKYAKNVRFASENSNIYAINTTPEFDKSKLPLTSQGMWVKPFTTFEKVNLKGGPKVSNIMYGSLYGGDSLLKDLAHGFKGVTSAFIGYNGSHQNYDGVSMNQQGGTIGISETIYKGNFFTGLTLSAGASAGEAYTHFGKENFAMLTAGIANKTGYNFEFKEGKIILQPTIFTAYTFANTFDYKNNINVKMNSNSLHMIQVVPGLKIIGNTKNGWQPYAGIDMVWNILGKTNVMANDVKLPHLSVKPYIQYGVGVQKSWKDNFTAYLQTMIRNGGRNGIVLSGGFRWTLGKELNKTNKVLIPIKNQKIEVNNNNQPYSLKSENLKKTTITEKNGVLISTKTNPQQENQRAYLRTSVGLKEVNIH